MKIFYMLLVFIATDAWADWEIDQILEVTRSDSSKESFSMKTLVNGQKMWRSVTDQSSKETRYSVFDSVRFYHCEKVGAKGSCSVLNEDPFDPLFLWATKYETKLSFRKLTYNSANKSISIFDQKADCYKKGEVIVVDGNGGNDYEVTRRSYTCFSSQVDLTSLTRKMVLKMKNLKLYFGKNKEARQKYESYYGLGVPLAGGMTVKSTGVGPYGVGDVKLKLRTTTIKRKKIDTARMKLPAGYDIVDLTDQLKSVKLGPKKRGK